MKWPGLIAVENWKRHWGKDADMPRLHSDLRLKLADGYEIRVSATDATYVRRNGEWHLMANCVHIQTVLAPTLCLLPRALPSEIWYNGCAVCANCAS